MKKIIVLMLLTIFLTSCLGNNDEKSITNNIIDDGIKIDTMPIVDGDKIGKQDNNTVILTGSIVGDIENKSENKKYEITTEPVKLEKIVEDAPILHTEKVQVQAKNTPITKIVNTAKNSEKDNVQKDSSVEKVVDDSDEITDDILNSLIGAENEIEDLYEIMNDGE